MTKSLSSHGASALWILLLTAASTITTLALSCATPFPSLAALAAVHMHRRDGITLMLVAWFASQAVGFVLLGYPHETKTLLWAAALSTAAVASALGAYALLPRFAVAPLWARLGLAYLAAFLAFKLVVLVWALFLGGVHSVISPAIVANQFMRNTGILVGLYLLYRVLVALGVPAANTRRVPA